MEKLTGDSKVPDGPSQEQATAFLSQATEDLQKKLGEGTRIVLIASRNGPGSWGYCWSIRGDSLGVLGLLKYASKKIYEWLGANLQ